MASPLRCVLTMALLLGWGGASAAEDAAVAPEAAAGAPAPAAAGAPVPAGAGASTEAGRPVARRRTAPEHPTVAARIDENVRRLTRGLGLDAAQQQLLRQILVDQHRQIMALRGGNPASSGDAAGSAMAVYEQTRARIRAMLNEQQKAKYPAEVPRDGLAPAQADLQHWMDLQDAKRRQDLGSEGAK